MHVEITPDNVLKAASWMAYGVASVVTFFWTLNRIIGKRMFYSGASEAVAESTDAAKELKYLIAELRQNALNERVTLEKILNHQETQTRLLAETVGALRALLSIRN